MMNQAGATSASFEKMPFGNFSKQGLEAISQGFDVYSKMTKSIFKIVMPSQEVDQEDIIAKWRHLASGNSTEAIDLFVDTLKTFGSPIPGGFKWWENVVNAWKDMSKGKTFMPSLKQSREASDALLAKWMKNSETFFKDMQDCLQKFVALHPSAQANHNDPQLMYKDWLDSSQEYYEARCRARYHFIKEQGKAYFEFLNSLLPESREATIMIGDKPANKKKVNLDS